MSLSIQPMMRRNFPLAANPPILASEHLGRQTVDGLLWHLQLKTRNRICLSGNYYPPKASLMRRKRDKLPPQR